MESATQPQLLIPTDDTTQPRFTDNADTEMKDASPESELMPLPSSDEIMTEVNKPLQSTLSQQSLSNHKNEPTSEDINSNSIPIPIPDIDDVNDANDVTMTDAPTDTPTANIDTVDNVDVDNSGAALLMIPDMDESPLEPLPTVDESPQQSPPQPLSSHTDAPTDAPTPITDVITDATGVTTNDTTDVITDITTDITTDVITDATTGVPADVTTDVTTDAAILSVPQDSGDDDDIPIPLDLPTEDTPFVPIMQDAAPQSIDAITDTITDTTVTGGITGDTAMGDALVGTSADAGGVEDILQPLMDEDDPESIPQPLNDDTTINAPTDASTAVPLSMPTGAMPTSVTPGAMPTGAAPAPTIAAEVEMVTKEEEVEEEEEEEIIEEEMEGGGIVGVSPVKQDSSVPIDAPTTDQSVPSAQTAPADEPTDVPMSNGPTEQPQQPSDAAAQPMEVDEEQFGPIYLDVLKMADWTNNDVCDWLSTKLHRFGHKYVSKFRESQIDGKTLLEQTEETLRDRFGVTTKIHCGRMMRDIVDSRRPLEQMQQIQDRASKDGGTLLSRFARFTVADINVLLSKLPELTPVIPKLSNFTGQLMLSYIDPLYLSQSLQITDANEQKLILDLLMYIRSGSSGIVSSVSPAASPNKTENGANSGENAQDRICRIVEQVWELKTDPDVPHYNLLPQHFIDPKYRQPMYPYYQQGAYGGYYGAFGGAGAPGGGPMGASQQAAPAPEPEKTPEPELPSGPISEWNVDDCVQWLRVVGSVYEKRYSEYFENVAMDGKSLLLLTPWALENICAIRTKSHIRDLTKGIDKLRDTILKEEMLSQDNVQIHLAEHPVGKKRRQSTKKRKQSIQSNKQATSNAVPNSPAAQPAAASQKRPVPTQQTPQQHQQPYPGYGQYGGYSQQQYAPPHGAPQQNGGPHHPSQHTQSGAPPSAAAVAAAAAEPSCAVCGKTGDVKRCSLCKSAFYCSREHQVSDWAKHAQACKAIQAQQQQQSQ